ncbi:MAG TPA: hypothetical protein VL094_11840 [Sphingomonadaceae bacterium]|nr:hypothetical protein [Sphingomonadaceae bacterium]
MTQILLPIIGLLIAVYCAAKLVAGLRTGLMQPALPPKFPAMKFGYGTEPQLFALAALWNMAGVALPAAVLINRWVLA